MFIIAKSIFHPIFFFFSHLQNIPLSHFLSPFMCPALFNIQRKRAVKGPSINLMPGRFSTHLSQNYSISQHFKIFIKASLPKTEAIKRHVTRKTVIPTKYPASQYLTAPSFYVSLFIRKLSGLFFITCTTQESNIFDNTFYGLR